MTDPCTSWGDEIRAYLVGRIHRTLTTGPIEHSRSARLRPPALRWWLFEGKRYSMISGPLAGAWGHLAERAAPLLATFNARIRIADHLDGQIDWARTIARGGSVTREYVAASSGVGLSEGERGALVGWANWIADEWLAYLQCVEVAVARDFESFRALIGRLGGPSEASLERLRRWAHAARRSRWPFLRHVVAETLRSAIEPDEVDQLPLPNDRATLFELLCIVRVARALAAAPGDIGWLNVDLDGNSMRIPGARCRYQFTLPPLDLLASCEYSKALAEAVGVFGVAPPRRIDALWELHPHRSGFAGVLIEAKSGAQQPGDALAQLRAYRAAIPRAPRDRFVVWGIGEQSVRLARNQLDWLEAAARRDGEDVWVFSGPDDIDPVMRALGIVSSDDTLPSVAA